MFKVPTVRDVVSIPARDRLMQHLLYEKVTR